MGGTRGKRRAGTKGSYWLPALPLNTLGSGGIKEGLLWAFHRSWEGGAFLPFLEIRCWAFLENRPESTEPRPLDGGGGVGSGSPALPLAASNLDY